jgi:hypothetical protein
VGIFLKQYQLLQVAPETLRDGTGQTIESSRTTIESVNAVSKRKGYGDIFEVQSWGIEMESAFAVSWR